MIKVQPQVESFQEALRRLVELQGKTMKEVILDQAALFVRDGIRLLPPFGKTPLKESASVQRAAGERATARDVGKAFNTLDKTRTDPKLLKAFENVAKRKGPLAAEALLRRFKIKRIAGVIEAPTVSAHNELRNEAGRVRGKRAQFFVWKRNSVDRFKREKSKLVGRAKAGFLYALAQIDALRGKSTFRPPAWVARHPGEPGTFVDVGSDDQFGITASNAVPFAQKHAERVQREGWTARMIAAPRQAEAIYKGMLRKARQLKL